MPREETTINLLLIEKDAGKVALIRQELDANMVHCHLNVIGHGKSAFAYLRQIGPYKSALVPDLVLFDFSRPDRESWSLLKRFGFGSGPVSSPVVLLTSLQSEEFLQSSHRERQCSSLFAPIDLSSFLQRMKEMRQDRFLNALSLISKLGLITVRLPGSSLTQRDSNLTAMIA